MAKPNKNNSSSRRSSKRKKQKRERSTVSESNNNLSDTRNVEMNAKESERSSSIRYVVYKRHKTLPSLKDLEKMFDDTSSDDDPDTNTRNNNKQLRLSEGAERVALLQNETSLKYNQTQTETVRDIPISDQTLYPSQDDMHNILNETSPIPTRNTNSDLSLNITNIDQPFITSYQNTYDRIDLTKLSDEESYLRQLENEESDDSNSSIKTITYDYNTLQNRLNMFSPLPSTSRDNETIKQNEILFNESMVINSSHCDTRPTICIENIASTSTHQHTGENSYETIVIEDIQPKRKVHVDNNIIFDADNYYTSQNNVPSDPDSIEISGKIDLTMGTQSPIIIDTTRFIDRNALDSFIRIQPDNSHPTSLVTVGNSRKFNITTGRAKTTTARTVDTTETTNANIENNIFNTVNFNTTDSESNANSSDDSPCEILSEVQPIKNMTRNNRRHVGGDSRGRSGYVANHNILLKKKRNLLKTLTIYNIYKDRRQRVEASIHRRNAEAMQSAQNGLEGYRNPSRVESDRNSENENLSQMDSQYPNSLGFCPICMDPLNQDIASTLCGHLFCMRCIKSALQTTGKKCPTCRKSLKGAGYHQIFI